MAEQCADAPAVDVAGGLETGALGAGALVRRASDTQSAAIAR
jgi:hypothetical protein